MALLTRGLVFVIVAATVDYCCSQTAVIPLWPCYSVFKIEFANPASPLSSVYRYTSKFVARNDEPQYPDHPDCVFTLEGPPNSRIELQLHNVVIQRTGYVSTSSHNAGNCSMGAVRIYNFTVTGDLVQVNEVCSSFQTGIKLLSDTNVAVVTSTIATGHFDLQATVIPQNNTGRNELTISLPTRKENVIHLGHTQNELNIINKPLNPPKLKSLSEKLSPSTSDELINEAESEDPDYYEDYSNGESKEDFNNHKSKLSKPNDHTFNHDLDGKLNTQKNNQLNHRVSQFNQPMNNQLHHQRNGQSLQQENQLPMNNPEENMFPQQHTSLSSQLVDHRAGNQFTQQNEPVNHSKGNQQNVKLHPTGYQQQNGQLSYTTDHTIENQFIHQQNEHLNQPINHFVGNNFNQRQNDHRNQPMNQFDNPASSQFTHQLNQPQNQLISHIISQLRGTQNFVHQPNQLHQGARDQVIQQTDQTNQLVDQLFQLEVQKNDPSNKPDNFQQNDQLKQLMNLLMLTAENQVQGQQNGPPSELANYVIHPTSTQLSKNVQISPLATQSIHPARIQFIQQEHDQSKQSLNTGYSEFPQQQNIQNKPKTQINYPTSTSFAQLKNQLSHTVSNLLSQKQKAQTNQYETQPHNGNSQNMPQKNGQFKHITSKQFTHPQYTQFSQPMGHPIHNANNQAIHQKNDQPQIPTDVIINSATNHFSDMGKSNKIENNLMHLIHNQVTDQKTDQTNQYVNKLIHPPINEIDYNKKISSQPHTYQLSDNDKFQEYQNKASNLALNIISDQSNPLMDVPAEKKIMLPVINEFNNILGNQTTYRENSKFTNNKNLFPHITDNKTVNHEPPQNKDETSVIKTSTKFNVTKILVRNMAPVYIHKPFIFENNTVTLFPDPDLISKA